MMLKWNSLCLYLLYSLYAMTNFFLHLLRCSYEWWELALKDNSDPQIGLLPLHPELRAKFNSTVAWEYTRSMSGKPYGYHNMIFSWIDTVANNYSQPLDAHLVFIFFLIILW